MSATDVVFLSGVRTAFGAFGGSLRDVSAIELGTIAAKAALEKSGVSLDDIDHVVFGNVMQTSADAIYMARHIGLKSGVPVPVPALTVNRLCGSGFEAIVQGARMLKLGEAKFALVGGTESMSQAPHVIRGARWGLRLNAGKLEDTLWEALLDPYCDCQMAMTAENLADQYGITREETDEYAHRSQMLAKEAWDSGRLAEEVVPVELKSKKGTKEFKVDEHMRPETTKEGLAKLPPYFKKDGTVTAGNASGIVDGAAALVLTTRAVAEDRGLKPLGRLVEWGNAGVEPSIMGIGPVDASKAALKRADMTLDQIDLVEVNEAFSPQYLAVEKELGLDRDKTNVNGGAIAIGHPLGATGARLTLTILHELHRRSGKYGLASACIGGGQGMTVIVEAY
ncbi:acetyl-CoA C-acetyltransferase [candidate division KSB1 bacterium]|nr:acetyl-CoA C-acetyltransferase [candidate division KSB1 bacterium]NIR72843.1 acetyl-CoA C-acetyltransferase [candidate division KSB1 bacterium]NIS26883.1 acetyl-CoA C-acetyltransferase [candidate division KSB1 bacterium]NIT73679.1 acetyl-CoA C-acetyltransferase [candidate division KSB1 bacterium]NIU27550.1 acetyl-CoA C-acetyltransferase [candidate division KSB1 bacterium]